MVKNKKKLKLREYSEKTPLKNLWEIIVYYKILFPLIGLIGGLIIATK
jgi:hypothetical protein